MPTEIKDLISRPKTFNDYIGNKRAKKILEEAIKAHTMQVTCLPHILIYGNAGTGKTTMANIIASEADYKIITTIGSALRFQGDILKLLLEINDNSMRGWKTILFIDEIHNLDKQSLPETIWYPVLEDFTLYSNLEGKPLDYDGVEYKATSNKHALSEPFCVIGATTDPGMLSAPLRRRFPIQVFMEDYSIDDLLGIIRKYTDRRHGCFITTMAAQYIAERARFNPATAISLVDAAIRRYIVSSGATLQYLACRISLKTVRPLLIDMGIMEHGIRQEDIRVLKTLSLHAKGMGQTNLAKTCGFSVNHYSELIEPFLKAMGYIFTTHKTFISPDGERVLNHLGQR